MHRSAFGLSAGHRLGALLLGVVLCLAALRAEATEAGAKTEHVVAAVEIPPYVMATPYGSSGIITEVVREAFARIGQPVRIEVMPWARGMEEVRDGRVSGLIPTIRTAEREQWLLFPQQPVYHFDMAFFARRADQLRWSGQLLELSARRFVKLRGAAFAPELDEAFRNGSLLIEEANSFASALRMVAGRRADLAAVPLLTGRQLLAQEGLIGEIEPLQPLVFRQPVYLALARTQAALLQPLDAALRQMEQDGSIARITEAYRQRRWMPQ